MKVPKKNISNRVSDIKRSSENDAPEEPERKEQQRMNTERVRQVLTSLPRKAADAVGISTAPRPRPSAASGRRPLFYIIVFIGCAAGVVAAGFLYVRFGLAGTIAARAERLRSAVGDIKSLDFNKAEEKLSPVIAEYDAQGARQGFPTDISGVLRLVSDGYRGFQDFSGHTASLLRGVLELEAKWPSFLFSSRGGELIALLEKMQGDVATVTELEDRLERSQSLFGASPMSTGDYVSFHLEANRIKNFLDALIPWLKSGSDHHLLVLLENPSELRPGGGFIGSYADVTIRGGSVASAEVHDINDADRLLEAQIIPPKQLWPIAKRWRASDANWFFDFSASARKVREMVEASRLYADQRITFDGVIGVSADAVGDVVAVTGPVAIGSSTRTLTSENFLSEIQASVQALQARKDPEPKGILQPLASAVSGRLAGLTDDERKALLKALVRSFERRDVAVYFKDPVFQNFFDAYDLTARVFEPAQDKSDDYLAVVNANIGGEKTDVRMEQKVVVQSRIAQDGSVSNRVVVTRTHRGAPDDPWWYRAVNQNYMQIFTPRAVQLEHVSGGVVKTMVPRAPYGTSPEYIHDADVTAIEATELNYPGYPAVSRLEQAGKNAFALWTTTPPGKKSTVEIEYKEQLFAAPRPGGVHEFVFERQRGSSGTYEVSITAPVGYVFKENGLPVYEYASSDPPGRLVIDLTFEKAP